MKRLFIAIPLNLNNLAKQSILEIQTQLSQNSIKWVSFDNLHLTLQFIGDTHENDIVTIIKILDNLQEYFNKFRLDNNLTNIYAILNFAESLVVKVNSSNYVSLMIIIVSLLFIVPIITNFILFSLMLLGFVLTIKLLLLNQTIYEKVNSLLSQNENKYPMTVLFIKNRINKLIPADNAIITVAADSAIITPVNQVNDDNIPADDSK